MTEAEWRGIGVQQSRGWQHYAIHRCVRLDVDMYITISIVLMPFIHLRPDAPTNPPTNQPTNPSTNTYIMHNRPEPHILLFRRPLGTDPVTGKVLT